MRCLIVHNLASGPHSDEIFTFIHALLATGDEVVMRCIGEALETEEAVADAYDEVKHSRAKFRSALSAASGGPAPRSQPAPRRAMYDAEADEDED